MIEIEVPKDSGWRVITDDSKIWPRLIVQFRKGGFLGLRLWVIRTYLPKFKEGKLSVWWPVPKRSKFGWDVFWHGLSIYIEKPPNPFERSREDKPKC